MVYISDCVLFRTDRNTGKKNDQEIDLLVLVPYLSLTSPRSKGWRENDNDEVTYKDGGAEGFRPQPLNPET